MPDSAISIRLTESDLADVRQEAVRASVTISEVVRDALRAHLASKKAERAVPIIDAAIGKHIDRLAAMLTKVFYAADMANWQASALCNAIIKDLKPEEIMSEARQRAAVDWRRAGTEIGVDEDVYQPRA